VRAKLITFHENINGAAASLKSTNCRRIYRFDSMKLQVKLFFVLYVQKTQLRWDYGNPTQWAKIMMCFFAIGLEKA
jgi:hypothetical protein